MRRVAILLSILLSLAPCFATFAQSAASSGQDSDKKSSQTNTTAVAVNQPARTSIKLEGGERIILRNRFGPIVVTGVDGGDTIEATATIINPGTGEFKYRLVASRTPQKIIAILTSAARPEQEQAAKNETKENVKEKTEERTQIYTQAPQARPVQQPTPRPTAQPPQPQQPPTGAQVKIKPKPRVRPMPVAPPEPDPLNLRGVGEMRLEVRLPRNAKIELIDSRRYAKVINGVPTYLTPARGDITVTNIDTPIVVTSSGNVQTYKVGAIEISTHAGNVNARDIAGRVNISTVTGTIVIKDAQGDVRAISISGPISIECARSRAEASNTNGAITLSDIGGDVDAATTGGSISFIGAIRDGGRYRLRSMAGGIRMLIQKEPPGFMANLSSYQGQVIVDFPLKSELAANTVAGDLPQSRTQPARRVTGQYGDGDARIILDSFNGTVQLGRAPAESFIKCR